MTRVEQQFLDAVESGDVPLVRRLLAGDPERAALRSATGVSVLLLAAYRGHDEVVAVLRSGRTRIDVWEGAALGELDAVRRAVEEDRRRLSAPAPDGFTPLHLALFFRRTAVASWLLERGADPDARAGHQDGMTALHSAAASRDARLVALVLQAGADPDAVQRGGFTALHSAARHGNLEMSRALLEAGANRGLRADDGSTPKDQAREGGHIAVVALLEDK